MSTKYEHVTRHNWVYALLPAPLEIIAWEDADNAEPGHPDHIYPFGSMEELLDAWDKVSIL